MTIGWKRGGGSNIFIPKTWPKVGSTISKRRVVPFSYAMVRKFAVLPGSRPPRELHPTDSLPEQNVCTHSYSLAWYSWEDWQVFIDWMALSGLNLVLAMTGQEEVQYKVFQHFGLNDTQIRTWFNGPAFLTWSRGQNEYGNDIAGELPRSWMQSQWALQKQILQRERECGRPCPRSLPTLSDAQAAPSQRPVSAGWRGRVVALTPSVPPVLPVLSMPVTQGRWGSLGSSPASKAMSRWRSRRSMATPTSPSRATPAGCTRRTRCMPRLPTTG